MKKLSYVDLSDKADRLSMRAHILEIAFTEMADDTFRYRDGRDTYTWKAYRLAGCAGGYLVCVFDGFLNKGKSIIYVDLLDTAIAHQQSYGAGAFTGNGMSQAVSRFHSARYTLTTRAS